MCFSANASFGAGVVLTVIGVAAIKKTRHPSQILFAAIPLFFAIQQIGEGILWVILPNPDYSATQKIITRFFLFFAQVIWPLWVPVAILLLEKESTRRNMQRILVVLGALLSLYLSYCLMTYHVQARIIGYHIAYEQDYPIFLKYPAGIFYIIATIVPPFFSHIKRMWLLGLTVLISYIITTIFYDNYLVSVWCFFASVISIAVYFIMLEIETAGTLKLSNR
jgi:hypothetical protein